MKTIYFFIFYIIFLKEHLAYTSPPSLKKDLQLLHNHIFTVRLSKFLESKHLSKTKAWFPYKGFNKAEDAERLSFFSPQLIQISGLTENKTMGREMETARKIFTPLVPTIPPAARLQTAFVNSGPSRPPGASGPQRRGEPPPRSCSTSVTTFPFTHFSELTWYVPKVIQT